MRDKRTALRRRHGRRTRLSSRPRRPVSAVGNQPVTITADGENTYIGDIATADDNVVVTYKGDTLYADHVIYDRSTKVVTARGDVRIYTGVRVYRGDLVTYNLDTKAITSANYRALDYPKLIAGKNVTTPGPNHYRLHDASFTTSNRQNPSFHLEASTMEYRPNDQVVMKNVVLYIGNVPVMYFPIFVQSLIDKRPAYQFDIGTSGQFGTFIDNKYNFVVNNRLRGTAEFDVREDARLCRRGRSPVFPRPRQRHAAAHLLRAGQSLRLAQPDRAQPAVARRPHQLQRL